MADLRSVPFLPVTLTHAMEVSPINSDFSKMNFGAIIDWFAVGPSWRGVDLACLHREGILTAHGEGDSPTDSCLQKSSNANLSSIQHPFYMENIGEHCTKILQSRERHNWVSKRHKHLSKKETHGALLTSTAIWRKRTFKKQLIQNIFLLPLIPRAHIIRWNVCPILRIQSLKYLFIHPLSLWVPSK